MAGRSITEMISMQMVPAGYGQEFSQLVLQRQTELRANHFAINQRKIISLFIKGKHIFLTILSV